MKCRHCIEHKSQNVAGLPAVDPQSTWNRVSNLLNQEIPTNCLEFLNPTESLHGVVQVLANTPRQFILPVVFNCHLYGSKSFYDLAARIADVWLVDLTFGNDTCAKSISGVTDYIKYAKLGLDAVTGRGAKVIVRMLVLPGHGSCCHGPVVELLSEYREELWVSILDQYVPVHEACRDPKLDRRPEREEITRLENLVDRYGLRNIGKGCKEFWTA
ncbi:conserved hypothetical protein [delta proteobacterium NaphS2]|nr:conserved hypothetical protein [delta proteobacterium NaphS2]